jgi:hypothetical protein
MNLRPPISFLIQGPAHIQDVTREIGVRFLCASIANLVYWSNSIQLPEFHGVDFERTNDRRKVLKNKISQLEILWYGIMAKIRIGWDSICSLWSLSERHRKFQAAFSKFQLRRDIWIKFQLLCSKILSVFISMVSNRYHDFGLSSFEQ